MSARRIEKLNSLLKEVISDVVRTAVKDPHLPPLVTITKVSVTKDLSYAKVFVSVIGDQKPRAHTILVLNRAAGFIAQLSSKETSLRYFPALTFVLDDSLDHQMRIEQVLTELRSKNPSVPPEADDLKQDKSK